MPSIEVIVNGRQGYIDYEDQEDLDAKLEAARARYPNIRVAGEPPDPVTMGEDSGLQTAQDFATGMGQGTLFGFADELAGGIAAAAGQMFRDPELQASLERSGVDTGYEGARDRIRGRFDEAQQRSPYAFAAGELAGGLAVPGVGALKGGQALTRGLSRLRPAGSLAATGGAAGALAGAGYSEGETAGQIAGDAAIGAGVGAVGAPLLGGALGYLGTQAGRLASGLGRRLAADPETAAMMRVRAALQADNINTADEARAMLDDMPGGRLADVGANLREEGVLAAKQPGAGKALAEDVLEGRQLGAYDRLVQAAREGLDTRRFGTWGDDYYQFMDDLTRQRKDQARPLYERAYQVDIEPTPEMVRISRTQAFQDAARRAMRNMRNKLDTFGPPRPPQSGGTVSSQFMDQILRELRDAASRAFRAGSNEAGADLNQIYKALRAEVLEQNPLLRQARGVYAGAKQLEEAADAGRGLLSGRKQYAEDVERLLQDMSDGERDAFSIGLIRGIMDRLADAGETSDAGRRLFNSRRVRTMLEEAFGDRQAFQRFYDAARREGRFQQTRNRVTGGSPTAQLLFGEAQGRPMDIQTADAGGIVMRMLSRMFNETVDETQLGPEDYEQMARLLFGEIDDATLGRIFNTAFETRVAPSASEGFSGALGVGGTQELIREF